MPRHPDDLIHDPRSDVSERRRPTVLQLEVIDLLELDRGHGTHVRLSIAEWRRVENVAARIESAAVPSPRPSAEPLT